MLENLFSELEKFTNEEISSDIKQILALSGFETESSLLCIDKETIAEVEKYANENQIILKNTAL